MIKLKATKASLTLVEGKEILTSGMANAVSVSFEFSPEWEPLRKTAVFSNGITSVDVVESQWDNYSVNIPHEILEKSGRIVTIGVYGTDGEKVVIPTVMCGLGLVLPGTDPNLDPNVNPTLPVYEEILNLIGNLEDLSTEAKDNLVNAINEIYSSGGGGGGSGQNGATFIPSVSPEGELSWTNDKGLNNPDPVNIKGPQGPQGVPGEKGAPGEPGKDGVQIDDATTEKDKTWSSHKMANIFAPAIKAVANGDVIAVDDVTQIEHDVECRVSGVTDLTTAKVNQHGKNLLDTTATDFSNWKPANVIGFGFSSGNAFLFTLPAKEVTISCSYTGGVAYFYVYESIDGKTWNRIKERGGYLIAIEKYTPITFIPDAKKKYAFWANDKSSFDAAKDLQIEFGNKPTPYEKPRKKVFSPTADGVVSGMRSVSPSMVLMTDTPGVVISARYNADTKKYIDKKFEHLKNAIISTGGNV